MTTILRHRICNTKHEHEGYVWIAEGHYMAVQLASISEEYPLNTWENKFVKLGFAIPLNLREEDILVLPGDDLDIYGNKLNEEDTNNEQPN